MYDKVFAVSVTSLAEAGSRGPQSSALLLGSLDYAEPSSIRRTKGAMTSKE